MPTEPTEVDPVTVVAPVWHWDAPIPDNPNYGGSGGPVIQYHLNAINFANAHITVDPSLANDPAAQAWKSAAKTALANLEYASQVYNSNDYIDSPGTSNNLTISSLYSFLNKIQIVITNTPVTNGATTTFNGSTYTITLNPATLDANRHYSDPVLDRNYVIFHELGHANADNIALARFLNSDNNITAAERTAIEAHANAFGSELAHAINAAYPSDSALAPYNGVPAAGFTLPVVGTPSADSISGGSGTDVLGGLEGQDTISGSAGADTIDGGLGTDMLSYASSAVAVTVNLSASQAITSGGTTTLISIEDVTGSAYNDSIVGSFGNNTVTGGGGNDTISGGDGNDIIQGNLGFDYVYGNAGNDTLYGGQDGDVLRGGQGNDSLIGDAASDRVIGDAGNDTVAGGLSADDFYTHSAAGADSVVDFNRAQGDRVVVESGVYTTYQSGANIVVDFQNGSSLTLTNATLSSMDTGWIFG